jgi:5-methylcytosine-specific restriction protein A
MKMRSGNFLAKFYKIGSRSAYCHREGRWYHPLKGFPGVYFDHDGCVVFQTEKEFLGCPYLVFDTVTVTIPGGLSEVPGYRRLQPSPGSL